jgi:hypothetical protein
MSNTETEEKIQMEPGIYEDVDFEDYVKIDAINHSELKAFSQTSPAHYKYNKDNKITNETKAKSEGRIYHDAVLEPEKFAKKYVHTPNKWEDYKLILPADEIKKLEKDRNRMFDGRTKANKIIMTAFNGKIEERLKKEDHLEVIDYLVYWKAEKIRESIKQNKACRKLLKNARFELTIVWIDPETGLKCKGRIDIDSEMKGFFADLKKTKDAHPFRFARDFRKHNYNSQMAFYADGLEVLGHQKLKAVMIIAVEDYEPFYVQPYYVPMSSSWITEGRRWYRQQMESLHYCKSTDHWHGYYDKHNDDFNLYELPELL